MAATMVALNHGVYKSSPSTVSSSRRMIHLEKKAQCRITFSGSPLFPTFSSALIPPSQHRHVFRVFASLPSSPNTNFKPSTKLYVSGLSFRTTEESLRNAFHKYGQLIEVNLVMDRIANRPRGFAFLRYAAEEESKKAIEEMHGKFLDGRIIFVEVARPRSEVRQGLKQNSS